MALVKETVVDKKEKEKEIVKEDEKKKVEVKKEVKFKRFIIPQKKTKNC